MKALTLKHPWAFAICYMGKRIENRSWRPPQAIIGQRIAIHGGVQPKGRDALSDIHRVALELLDRFGLPEGFDDVTLQQVITPGIVAVATLRSIITASRDPWFDGSGVGWELANVHVFEKPIPCTGAQGLWDVPREVLQQINEAIGVHGTLSEAMKTATAL